MKSKPILFSTEMVQAILEGRKTQTRRVIKGLEELKEPFFQSLVQHASGLITFSSLETDKVIEPKNPYGNVGDILWVRESFTKVEFKDQPTLYLYKANPEHQSMKWKPSIHMPKEACRLFLKITNVRVERLRDIPREDCVKEGIAYKITPYEYIKGLGGSYYDYIRKTFNQSNIGKISPSMSFFSLWESINGKESLESNPWVWVIEFERIEKPENF